MEQCTRTHIATQLMSGKWLLTITAGTCLLAITVTDCVLALTGRTLFVDPAALLSIVTAVVMAYFGRAPETRIPGSQVMLPGADPTVDTLAKK